MIQTDGLDILLAWLIFLALLAVLGWLLARSGRSDALSTIGRGSGRSGQAATGDAPAEGGEVGPGDGRPTGPAPG